MWKIIFHTSFVKIYTAILGVLILSITARYLGPAGRGQIAVIQSLVGLFCMLGNFSLGQVVLHKMTTDSKGDFLGNTFASLVVFTFIFTVIGWFVAIAIYLYNPSLIYTDIKLKPLLIGFGALPFLIWEQYNGSILSGLNKLKLFNLFQLYGRTITLLLTFLLIAFLDFKVEGALIAILVGQIIVSMGGIRYSLNLIKEKGLALVPTKSEINNLLYSGVKLQFNAVGSFLLNSASILLLYHYLGQEATGNFQMAAQLISMLAIIPLSACMVIYGDVVKLGPDKAWLKGVKLIKQVLILMLLLSVIAALLAPVIIKVLAGANFMPAVKLFRIMLPGFLGMTFSILMSPQWIGRGYFIQSSLITLFIGLASFLVNIKVIPICGVESAAYIFSIAYFFGVPINLLMVKYCNNRHL
jgi:hypothetical protein